MQDLINKVKMYNELQADTVKFIDELILRANDTVLKDKLETLKDAIYSDTIPLQKAIRMASMYFDEVVA